MANNILSDVLDYELLYIVDTYDISRSVRVFSDIKKLRKYTKNLLGSYCVTVYRINKDDIKEIYDEVY